MSLNLFTQTSDAKTISATTSSDRVDLAATNSASSTNVVVSNLGTTWAYVRFGDNTVTASATGFALGPGMQVVLGKPAQATYAAAIMVSGSATIHFCPGLGV